MSSVTITATAEDLTPATPTPQPPRRLLRFRLPPVTPAPRTTFLLPPLLRGLPGLRRAVTFLMSALSLLCAGSLFAFGSFSEDLRVRFGFGSKDINVVSALGNTALYTSFLIVGPVWDRFGVRVTMLMSAATFGLGFLLMYLAYVDRLPASLASVGAISFYYFLAGFGSCASFMATFAINLVNFPTRYSGFVSGLLGIFYALSATLYAQIYALHYSSDTAGFLLFMTVSVTLVNLVASVTMWTADGSSSKSSVASTASVSSVSSSEEEEDVDKADRNAAGEAEKKADAEAVVLEDARDNEPTATAASAEKGEPSADAADDDEDRNDLPPRSPTPSFGWAGIDAPPSPVDDTWNPAAIEDEDHPISTLLASQNRFIPIYCPAPPLTASAYVGGTRTPSRASSRSRSRTRTASRTRSASAVSSEGGEERERSRSRARTASLAAAEGEAWDEGGEGYGNSMHAERRGSGWGEDEKGRSSRRPSGSAAGSMRRVRDEVETEVVVVPAPRAGPEPVEEVAVAEQGAPQQAEAGTSATTVVVVEKRVAFTGEKDEVIGGGAAEQEAGDGEKKGDEGDSAEPDMTPWQIIRSLTFWLFTASYVWQQGITYFNNIGTIVKVLAGSDASAAEVAATTGFHVTLLSVSNCIARLAFGAGSDLIVSRLGADRSSLFVVSEVLTAVPLGVVGFAASLPPGLLAFSSVLTGFAFGAASALFPPLTADFFGLKYYGSACALVMVGIPVGIVVSNVIFGAMFDTAVSQGCSGSGCYRNAFIVFLAIQIVPVILSAFLFFRRTVELRIMRRRVASGKVAEA
ncbi:hypothetical protein HDU96_006851 [Phlyctochytrium bullatum]|nr:hypothetical protein HDU96_006851 [Phlyctochytrium bullatum]